MPVIFNKIPSPTVFRKGLPVVAFFIFLLAPMAKAGEDARIYARAVQAARAGHIDFAFMQYRSILNESPESPYSEYALFASGEYYFLLPQRSQAAAFFHSYINRFPDAKGKLFALAYLYKLAQLEHDDPLAQELARKIVADTQLSLIFRDFKEYRYQSPLAREHKVIFHIDHIEFFVKGERFAEIVF